MGEPRGDPPRESVNAVMGEFPFEALRRWPDVEASNLHAVDAADRLVLDVAAPFLAVPGVAAGLGGVVVIGDRYGALTLGAIAVHGARHVRVHQDALTGELALAANSRRTLPPSEIQEFVQVSTLERALVEDAAVVLLNFPRGMGELDEIAGLIAAHARPDVVVVAGGMIKHMTPAMNDVLLRYFERIDVSHARQKARVITARTPRRLARSDDARPAWPQSEFHSDIGMWVCAHGGAFAGASLDIGTRALLQHLDEFPDFDTAMDLGCGTGVLAAALARSRPGRRVVATDQSAAAVASALATAAANEAVVEVVRDDAAAGWPAASVDLVLLNPPFHIGAAVHAGAALKMFEAAARVLRPGGELWAVWNSHLGYPPALRRIVGPTRQVSRNRKFTVTASTRRP